MPINKKKLALILSIPIFMALSIPDKQWNLLLDLEPNYNLGRVKQAEYEYARSQGMDPFQLRADLYNKCMKSQPACIADRTNTVDTAGTFWGLSTRQTAEAICSCNFSTTLVLPPPTIANYTAGLIFSLKTLLPITRTLLISLFFSWILVFAAPATFIRIKKWLYY